MIGKPYSSDNLEFHIKAMDCAERSLYEFDGDEILAIFDANCVDVENGDRT